MGGHTATRNCMVIKALYEKYKDATRDHVKANRFLNIQRVLQSCDAVDLPLFPAHVRRFDWSSEKMLMDEEQFSKEIGSLDLTGNSNVDLAAEMEKVASPMNFPEGIEKVNAKLSQILEQAEDGFVSFN